MFTFIILAEEIKLYVIFFSRKKNLLVVNLLVKDIISSVSCIMVIPKSILNRQNDN